MAPDRCALLVATLCVGLAGCSYTSPVVAPPMEIHPPAAAQLQSQIWQPTTELELAAGFREALIAYERAVRQLEHSAGGNELTPVRAATQRLGMAIVTVPHDRSDLVVAWSARVLMGDELWTGATATPAGWHAAAERAIAVASAALARIVESSYAGVPGAMEGAADLRARAEALRAGRDVGTAPRRQGDVLGAFRSAQSTLDAIAARLAYEEASRGLTDDGARATRVVLAAAQEEEAR